MNQFNRYCTSDSLDKSQFMDIESCRTLEGEMKKLSQVRSNSAVGTIEDYDAEQRRVVEIFERIDEARVQLEVSGISP